MWGCKKKATGHDDCIVTAKVSLAVVGGKRVLQAGEPVGAVFHTTFLNLQLNAPHGPPPASEST